MTEYHIEMNVIGPILIASNNLHKINELRGLLEPRGYHVRSPDECRVTLEVQESGMTFEQNASLKATEFSQVSGLPCLADDSGLEVDALDGAPGVYSHRYGDEGRTDRDRYLSLLEEMQSVPSDQRGARFVSVIALVMPGQPQRLFRGEVCGRIAHQPQGSHGFGYDPIFFYPPLGKTFGEMTADEKKRVSHRSRAACRLLEYLLTGEHEGTMPPILDQMCEG